MAVFLDIYGNEARVLLETSEFTTKPETADQKSTPKK